MFKFCSRISSAGTGTEIIVSSSVQVLLAHLVCRNWHCDCSILRCSSFTRAFHVPVPALRFWFAHVFKFFSCFWSAGTGTAILVSSSVQILLVLFQCRYRHNDFGFFFLAISLELAWPALIELKMYKYTYMCHLQINQT